MDSEFDRQFETILEFSRKINSNVINLTRSTLLAVICCFKDGLQYRQLKASLNLSDGKLVSNLNKLREMGYLMKTEESLDNKMLDVYTISNTGEEELKKMLAWAQLISKFKEACER
jgi:DNA-binding MarR family transcriptional regulator